MDTPLQPAHMGRRIVSGLIDLFCALAVLLVLQSIAVAVFASVSSEAAVGAAIQWSVIIAIMIFPLTIEALTHGRSAGKYVMGIETVSMDGFAVSFRSHALRALIGIVEKYMTVGVIAAVTAAITPGRQRLGDLMAGTITIRRRTYVPSAQHISPSYELRLWAQTADISRVDSRDIAAIRGMLHGFHEAALQQLAYKVYQQVRPAPPLTSAADFLSAVAVRNAEDAWRRIQHQAHSAPAVGTDPISQKEIRFR